MTPVDSRISRCSNQNPLRFHWYPGPGLAASDPDKAACKSFFQAVSPPGRAWDPHQRSIAMSEFRAILRKAKRGALTPVEQVDPTDIANIYEVRLRRLPVVTVDEDGVRNYFNVEVRMYHSEPRRYSQIFIGHVIHEKVIDPDPGVKRRLQDNEIDAAARIRDIGESENWGIAA